MTYFLRWSLYLWGILYISPALQAQNAIITQALSFSSSCPGSTITVPFSLTGTYTTSTIFTVQLSDGGDYKDISTGKTVTGGPSQGSYAIRATLPGNQAPGTNYTLRVNASNPDIIGSPTNLIIKSTQTKPSPPVVDSVISVCQSVNESTDLYTQVFVRIVPGTTPTFYYDSTFDQFTQHVDYSLADNTIVAFNTFDGQYKAPLYIYPVHESTYYVSQVVDGCESDKVRTIVRTLYRPKYGVTPTNRLDPSVGSGLYGRLNYCQGDKAYPLNINGHSPAPEHYHVLYSVSTNATTSTKVPPTPDTSVPGVTIYSFYLEPDDFTKACGESQSSITYLVVTVNPRPTKPPTTTSRINYYQGQSSSPLSASLTDSTASLVWYGPNLPGDSASKIAPTPPTDKVGSFTYYVAQRIGVCESERAAITVMVNVALGIEDPALADAVDVYPNPVLSKLTVRIQGLSAHQPAQLALLDANGRVVLSQDTQRETSTLTLDSYPAGHYLLRIKVGDRAITRRIVKL